VVTSEVNDGKKLRVDAQLDGIEECAIKPFMTEILDMPIDFTTLLFLIRHPVNITLSQDSKVISVDSRVGPQCSSTAIRDSTSAISTNTVLFVGLLCGLVEIKSFF
jgi:hypothetical protein